VHGGRSGLNALEPPSPAIDCIRPARSARIRLVCLPHAGGGASSFHALAGLLPDDVEVVALQPPGRERRIGEPPVSSLTALVGILAETVAPLAAKPYALFGHSFGALAAFELARELRRRELPEPLHLVVSAFRAPHLRRRGPELHQLHDEALAAELHRLGATPPELLADRDVAALVLRAYRADLEACETYAYVDAPRFRCPLAAWGGRLDPDVKERDLEPWALHTTGPFELRTFPGSHSYPLTGKAAIARALSETLAREPVTL
jgi:surfactin synthase thioesterase subunit